MFVTVQKPEVDKKDYLNVKFTAPNNWNSNSYMRVLLDFELHIHHDTLNSDEYSKESVKGKTGKCIK